MIRAEEGFRSVVFDCDSTLVTVEGIDELAGPHAAEVRALTDAAMAGALPLEEVYGRRLEAIRPGREQLERLGSAYVETLVPDARETVAALRWLGRDVRIISGGLRPPVEALARELAIAADAVGAVAIHFAADGSYLDFDRDSPLARSGGKAEQIRAWRLARPILFVGDGATDAEARDAVDAFVAYAGVVYRPEVAAVADLVLTAPSLAPALALAAGYADRERLRDSPWAALHAYGERLLQESPTARPPASRSAAP